MLINITRKCATICNLKCSLEKNSSWHTITIVIKKLVIHRKEWFLWTVQSTLAICYYKWQIIVSDFFFCFSTLQENHLFEGHLWRWGPHGQPHLRQLALLSPSCARRTGKWSLRPVAVGHGPSSLGLPFALLGLQSGLLKLLSSFHTEPHLGSAAHKRAKLNCWI